MAMNSAKMYTMIRTIDSANLEKYKTIINIQLVCKVNCPEIMIIKSFYMFFLAVVCYARVFIQSCFS